MELLNCGPVLTLVLGVAIGVAVGVGAPVEELGVWGVAGVVEGGLVGVGAPVVVVSTVPGVGADAEGGTVAGEEGPVVVPLGAVVCRPAVVVPGTGGGEGVVPPAGVTVGFVPVGGGLLDVSSMVGGVLRSVVDPMEEGEVD